MLTLKELTEILENVNKSINDINRDNGVKSNALIGKDYSTKVSGIESGSIIISIFSTLVVPVTLSVLSNYIYDRLKKIIKIKKKKNTRLIIL